MFRKLVKQNKALLLTSMIILLIFVSVLYVAIDQIYEREASRQHEQEMAQLLTTRMTVRSFFDNVKFDLLFLGRLPSVRNYVMADFASSQHRDEVKELFLHFAETHNHFSQFKIIDPSGQIRIVVDNKPQSAPKALTSGEWRDGKPRDYFEEILELEQDQIHSSPIDFHVEFEDGEMLNAPVLWVSTPLQDGGGRMAGVVSLAVNISEFLRLLPEHILVQTEEGNLISIDQDGVAGFHRFGYVFPESHGDMVVSDVETIHYTTEEFLPGRRWILGIFHRHPELKAILNRMIMLTVMLGGLFLCLVLVVDYLNFKKGRELMSAEQAIIFSLASLAEGRDPETGAHLFRTRKCSVILAKELAKDPRSRRIVTDDFLENLSEAAPLHDIGKVRIPDSILLKPAKLTDEEFEEMKDHTSSGAHIIRNAIDKFKLKQPFLNMSLNICAYHHEKHNGKGYWGLKGEQIPLEARIFAVCDAYDAIRSERPYKEALPHEEAVKNIKADSGTHFAPDIVNAFLRCEKEFALLFSGQS